VATSIELGNRFENMGAQMVKEVATNTSYEAGDGTTTATVLAQAIFREGAKMVSAGASPVELKRGIDSAVRDVIAHLAKTSRPTRDRGEIARVGTVSANGDAFIGEMIADAMARLRADPPAVLGGRAVVRMDDLETGIGGLPPTDGLRFTLSDARVIIRPSGTEPKLKCYLQVVVPVSGDVADARATADSELAGVRDSVAQVLAL
jgi:phosphomannomutase